MPDRTRVGARGGGRRVDCNLSLEGESDRTDIELGCGVEERVKRNDSQVFGTGS